MKLFDKLLKRYYNLISRHKVRFLIVGGTGFIVNFTGLTILYHIFKADIILSQILSAELAVITTFCGNNFWTFKFDHHHSILNKLLRYHLGAAGGIAINDLIVILMIKYVHMYYGLALIIGSVVGLFWNYAAYKRVVFKPKQASNNREAN